jgi:hypothetical protein
VLLTGIHLLQTGEVQANLPILNAVFRLPYIDDLIAAKTTERTGLAELDWPFHDSELRRLEGQLDTAFAASKLGENRDFKGANDLLVDLRLATNQ